jgi:four helix bundle protein
VATIHIFEDLIAWQKARLLASAVAKITSTQPFRLHFKLKAQLHSAGFSVMSNIAEGFERGRRREFHQFLSIAKGSLAEVRSLVHHSFDVGLIDQEAYRELIDLCCETSRVVAGLRRSVDPGTRLKGKN